MDGMDCGMRKGSNQDDRLHEMKQNGKGKGAMGKVL